jgi:hypothetical protein
MYSIFFRFQKDDIDIMFCCLCALESLFSFRFLISSIFYRKNFFIKIKNGNEGKCFFISKKKSGECFDWY